MQPGKRENSVIIFLYCFCAIVLTFYIERGKKDAQRYTDERSVATKASSVFQQVAS